MTRPPRLARWLVEHALPRDVREDVAGDLLEMYHRDCATGGRVAAAGRYWRHAVSCAIRFSVERCRRDWRGGVSPMGAFSVDPKRLGHALAGWRMDLRLALRMAARHPALTIIAVFGIAVATAIAATIVTVVGEQSGTGNLPLPDGDRIVALQKMDAVGNGTVPLVVQDLLTWREQLSRLRDIGAFRTITKNLTVPAAAPEPVQIAEMSAAGFVVAGISPRMGRVLDPRDEQANAAPVVVIGHDEWRRRFGASPDVLGMSVRLGETSHTVVGVMPEAFAFPLHHAFWIPLRPSFAGRATDGRGLSIFGRLAPGETLESAQAELATLAAATTTTAERRLEPRPRVVSYAYQFSELDNPANRLALQVMRFLVAVLFVVITINIAVLVYARTAARHAEIAVRTALGASRGRIVTQLFLEGLVLAGAGALAGVVISVLALAQVREGLSQTEALPFWVRFQISGGTIAYVTVLTLAAAALMGVVPALKATGARVQNRLQALTAGGGGDMQLGRVWTGLILLQVAFAVGLLPPAVVRMSELARGGWAQFGIPPREFLVAQLSRDSSGTNLESGDEAARQFAMRYAELERRVRDEAAVRDTTFAAFAPGFELPLVVQTDAGVDVNARANRVAGNFFDTFNVPVLTGRSFSPAEAGSAERAVVVNRSFARLVADRGVVLGSRVRLGSGNAPLQEMSGIDTEWHQVVGVVEDFPATTGSGRSEPRIYRAITPESTQALTMVVHLHPQDTAAWGGRLRQLAGDVDPSLQVHNVAALEGLLRQHQRSMRLLAGVFAAMTLCVLLLSAAGIYAMMAFAVTQRRREIGIRLALGAGARKVLWALFSRAGGQLLGGTALGAAVALLMDRALMSGEGTGATAAVVLLMVAAGLLAAVGPARRGLSIEPAEALRDSVR